MAGQPKFTKKKNKKEKDSINIKLCYKIKVYL